MPPHAVRSSDQRSLGCAAVLVMLLRHGNHVCGAVSVAQVLQEGASRLPHWPMGAEWMEEASRDVSASPGLEPRPTGHFRAWPERSGSCPAWARASWEDGRTFPEGHAGQRAGGPLAGAPGCQWPHDRGRSPWGPHGLTGREELLFSFLVWRLWSEGDAAAAAVPTWEGQGPGATVACWGLGGRQTEPGHPGHEASSRGAATTPPQQGARLEFHPPLSVQSWVMFFS